MAAACAVCGRPITKQSRFVIVDTEAVHDACIGRMHQSLVHRLRDKTRQLQGEIDQRIPQLEGLLAIANNRAQDAQREMDRMRRERDQARSDAAQARTDAAHAIAETTTLRAEARIVADRQNSEIANLRRERDAARQEAALHQAISGTGSGTAKPPEASAAPREDRDDSAVRFSLLELDST